MDKGWGGVRDLIFQMINNISTHISGSFATGVEGPMGLPLTGREEFLLKSAICAEVQMLNEADVIVLTEVKHARVDEVDTSVEDTVDLRQER